jgi:hypothetical protein
MLFHQVTNLHIVEDFKSLVEYIEYKLLALASKNLKAQVASKKIV